MNELKILSRFLGRNMCEEELQKVIDVVSKKRNLETISFTDFMNYMNKIGYRPATLAEVERVFKQMDTKRKGYLTMNDFLDSILAIKPHFPRNLIEDMFKQIDTDKTQRITLDSKLLIYFTPIRKFKYLFWLEFMTLFD